MWPFSKKDWQDAYRQLPPGELLNHIRNGDEKATHYLMETYTPLVLVFAKKALFGKSEALGEPGDYAHNAILLLWTRASAEGAAVLNHDSNDPILDWLKQTVTFRICNAERKEHKHWREETQPNNEDEQTESILAQIADKDAVHFTDKPEKELFEVVNEVLAIYPQKSVPFDTLVRKRWMEGLTWKETAAALLRLYPDHDPAFDVGYVQKTYWDRKHKKPFFKLLRETLKRYGYDS